MKSDLRCSSSCTIINIALPFLNFILPAQQQCPCNQKQRCIVYTSILRAPIDILSLEQTSFLSPAVGLGTQACLLSYNCRHSLQYRRKCMCKSLRIKSVFTQNFAGQTVPYCRFDQLVFADSHYWIQLAHVSKVLYTPSVLHCYNLVLFAYSVSIVHHLKHLTQHNQIFHRCY